ncbi:hypothetical protein KOAAANKH_02715 [Brevundimonas sp. NIBR10]|nr:hypothetical protein KOAAANKH_02715 [Brevundimonas sp. NIBR10]
MGAYVAATPDLPFTLGEIYRQLTDGDPRDRLPKLLEQRRKDGDPLPAGAVTALNDFCSSGENTFASIRQSITTRMGLWLNPLVDAATSQSDFDLRGIRGGRLSLYLAASPENMDRVAPLYALLFQQLVDLNSRALPDASDPQTLVLLDEFARLGRAPVLAHAFAWVAGYGLRLLPVIQSPSQLRALYGPDVTEDILTNCGLEIVFAPKELKVAQELSERLGYYTYRGRSRSRPMGLGQGRRSLTDSDQKRALMLPQELMQFPQHALIVLKAGLAPTRGRKLVYFSDPRFTARQRPPPDVPVAPTPARSTATVPPTTMSSDGETDMDFDSIVRRFAAEGLTPPPPGASEKDVQAWLDRVTEHPDLLYVRQCVEKFRVPGQDCLGRFEGRREVAVEDVLTFQHPEIHVGVGFRPLAGFILSRVTQDDGIFRIRRASMDMQDAIFGHSVETRQRRSIVEGEVACRRWNRETRSAPALAQGNRKRPQPSMKTRFQP